MRENVHKFGFMAQIKLHDMNGSNEKAEIGDVIFVFGSAPYAIKSFN